VKAMAELVAGQVGTIGVGLSHCHVSPTLSLHRRRDVLKALYFCVQIPGTAVGENHLQDDEVEIGMGEDCDSVQQCCLEYSLT
jgi:hypothetical protein